MTSNSPKRAEINHSNSPAREPTFRDHLFVVPGRPPTRLAERAVGLREKISYRLSQERFAGARGQLLINSRLRENRFWISQRTDQMEGCVVGTVLESKRLGDAQPSFETREKLEK